MSRFPADRLKVIDYSTYIDIPVLYGDLDTNSHINNVVMGRFFEHARYVNNMVLRRVEAGLSFLVARVAIDYLSEGKFGTPMTVGTRFGRAGGTSMGLEQAAFQGDRVVALCDTVIVRMRDGVPADLTDPVRAEIARVKAEPTGGRAI